MDKAFYLSLIFILIATVGWGMLNVICKWVSKEFPDTSIEDFSVVALFISGMLGVICSVPFMSEIITGYDFNGLW